MSAGQGDEADSEAVVMYRPVGPRELELIAASDNTGFPPRLTGQPIFYPVLTEEYARKIARDWNATSARTGFRGYVTRFRVDAAYAARFPVQTVGASWHRELWVPADELAEFNNHILGPIEVVATYEGGEGREPVEVEPPR